MSWRPRARLICGAALLAGCGHLGERPSPDPESLSTGTANNQTSPWERAKLAGADFRAVGNEPGWDLEIRDGDRIDFTYDYGAHSLSLPILQRQVDTERRETRYRASDFSEVMTVLIEGIKCSDTMSDRVYSVTVRVQLGVTVYQGCGEALH
jgi:uncharacterized membrane protein